MDPVTLELGRQLLDYVNRSLEGWLLNVCTGRSTLTGAIFVRLCAIIAVDGTYGMVARPEASFPP